jgi:4-amino-4-deoxy-L-arabinose transferase-like glycosyltransferase
MFHSASRLEDSSSRDLFARWALVIVILIGAILRVWGINFGLPYTAAPDEPTHFTIALHIFQTGDLNPGWLNYPTLTFYINALALIPFYLVGKTFGVFASPADIPVPEVVTMGVGLLQLPAEFLYARLITAAFGIASLVLVFLLGRKVTRTTWGGVLAALLLAVSPAAVHNSHLIRPDTFVVFFVLLSVLFAIRIVEEPRWANYFWASVAAGFAVSCKYNVPLVIAPILAAHLIRFGWAGWRRKEIYLAGIVSALAFLLTSPYIVLDFPLFWRGFGFEIFKQAEGHAGAEGNTVLWYLNFLWTTENILVVFAALQAARLLRARSRSGLTLLAFPVCHYLFINLFIVRNDRTILALLPFLHLLAAWFVLDLFAWMIRRVSRPTALASTFALCAVMTLVPLTTSIASDVRLTQRDSRDTAREWIAANLPRGTRLAQEAYTPYVDTRQYVVQGIHAIIDRPLEWYPQNGFEYLVFSEGQYGRLLAEPERYAEWLEQYNAFFQRFNELRRFDDNDYEIRIYKTDVILPPHRIAARYGDYGELVELIGYDDVQWNTGAPLRARLFWRMIGDKPEPFEVELRLLDAEDREIAITRNDLFQGKGWRVGMFDEMYQLPVSAIPPGVYRLQVNVIWTRYAYHLPAFSWAEQRIDPVIVQVTSGK